MKRIGETLVGRIVFLIDRVCGIKFDHFWGVGQQNHARLVIGIPDKFLLAPFVIRPVQRFLFRRHARLGRIECFQRCLDLPGRSIDV